MREKKGEKWEREKMVKNKSKKDWMRGGKVKIGGVKKMYIKA